jgi:hypothetical protein
VDVVNEEGNVTVRMQGRGARRTGAGVDVGKGQTRVARGASKQEAGPVVTSSEDTHVVVWHGRRGA